MIKDVILPEVSENVDSGDVVQVLVKIGDIIEKDQSLIELETDKAAVEIPSTEKGKVTEVLVKVGDSIKIGAPIIKIDTDNESSPDAEIKSPEIRTEDNSKESVKDKSEDQVIYKKSDKTDNQENEDKKPLQAGTNIEHTTDSRNIGNEKINNLAAPASPSVRLLARELGIEINNVSGSGPGGRISADDVKKFAKAILQGNTKVKDTEIKALPDFSKWGHIDIEEMSKVRKITAAAMAYAWSTIPQVTQYDKADITNLELFRNKNEKLAEKNNGKLTVTSILVKIISYALIRFPDFNSSIDIANSKIIRKKYYNIGIAVDTERGLLVPVIKDTDKKSILDISVELSQLAEKARDKKITPEEMEGGNFTISNLGGIGGTGFSPIVYSPQVAILGVSRSSIEPVFIGNEFKPGKMLPLSLSYDHRIIDGAEAARFLRWVCDVIENPYQIIL